MLQRDCTCARQQRQTILGALALGLSEVSAANVPGMGRAFASFLRLGETLLRAATRERQSGKYRRASSAYKWIRILVVCRYPVGTGLVQFQSLSYKLVDPLRALDGYVTSTLRRIYPPTHRCSGKAISKGGHLRLQGVRNRYTE